jgi:hypothetical protein
LGSKIWNCERWIDGQGNDERRSFTGLLAADVLQGALAEPAFVATYDGYSILPWIHRLDHRLNVKRLLSCLRELLSKK